MKFPRHMDDDMAARLDNDMFAILDLTWTILENSKLNYPLSVPEIKD